MTQRIPAADDLPAIIAHRGNALEFPENTLESLGSAVELGLRHLEFDVQLTSDLVPVLLHDADLTRVADRPDSVHDLTAATLASIPVGEVARLGEAHADARAPTLARFVEALTGWPGVTAFVEVKRSSIRRFGREPVLTRIAAALEPVLDRCVLISFDIVSVNILRQMTGARIGWVITSYDDDARTEADALGPEFLFANLERLPAEPASLWSGPWDWAIYEVREIETALQYRARGAKYVETMDVRGLLAAYSRHARP